MTCDHPNLSEPFGERRNSEYCPDCQVIILTCADGERIALKKPKHNIRYCEDGYADEPEIYDTGCHDGELYGPCGAETCYGQCEKIGLCPCICHEDET